jgi:hypothetical protein
MAVSKEVKETITITIDEVFAKMNSISWLERQRVMKDEAFKNTEKILYCFNFLVEHVADEQEYFEWAKRGKSTSVVRFNKQKAEKPDSDQILEDRYASYVRSKTDVDRIKKALEKIKSKKGYEVIEYRYLRRKEKDEVYTYEEIAELLAGKGYNENLNETTVRGYKNNLVRDMAVLLFGSDAI